MATETATAVFELSPQNVAFRWEDDQGECISIFRVELSAMAAGAGFFLAAIDKSDPIVNFPSDPRVPRLTPLMAIQAMRLLHSSRLQSFGLAGEYSEYVEEFNWIALALHGKLGQEGICLLARRFATPPEMFLNTLYKVPSAEEVPELLGKLSSDSGKAFRGVVKQIVRSLEGRKVDPEEFAWLRLCGLA